MLNRLNNYYVTGIKTYDVDEQASGLQHWNQEFIQLSCGNFFGCIEDIWFGNIQIFRDRCNQSVHQIGKSWDGARTIAHVIHAEGEGLFSGDVVRTGDLVTLADDQPLNFRTPQNIDCIASSIDTLIIDEHASAVWGVDFQHRLPGRGHIETNKQAAEAYGESLTTIYQSIIAAPEILSYSQISKSIEEQILNTVVQLGLHAESGKPASSVYISRLGLVNKAKEFMLDKESECFTISDICRHLNVSRRTLQYAFETICDTNPIAYLKYLRLHHVRRVLKKNFGNPACKIGDIAAHYGFWHFSRFSLEYRQLFGESPSATVGRALPRAAVDDAHH